MQRLIGILMGAVMLVMSVQGRAADEQLRLYGYAYDLKSGKYLYTEVHHQNIHDGHWVSGTIDYYAPGGTQIGHKTLDFSSDPAIPVYRLEQKSQGYIEGISAVNPTEISMFKQEDASSAMKTGTIKRVEPMAADSGFHVLIRQHFAELMTGKKLAFKLAVAGELDSFSFSIQRVADETWMGQPAVHFRVEPDSLLRFLVSPLNLLYRADDQKLLEYRGISNIHDPATGKAYDVRIDYYPTKPADAPEKLPPLTP
ncbi:MAG: hypothetical protein ACRESS_08200 [Stenotrophobium sp.]